MRLLIDQNLIRRHADLSAVSTALDRLARAECELLELRDSHAVLFLRRIEEDWVLDVQRGEVTEFLVSLEWPHACKLVRDFAMGNWKQEPAGEPDCPLCRLAGFA